MNSIDLTDYREMQLPAEVKIIMSCYIRLDKKTILDALSREFIFIDGEYYIVPERKLLGCLIDKEYGETFLELEKV